MQVHRTMIDLILIITYVEHYNGDMFNFMLPLLIKLHGRKYRNIFPAILSTYDRETEFLTFFRAYKDEIPKRSQL